MTCLHVAARRGHTDLLSLLYGTGKFDINQKVINSLDLSQKNDISLVTQCNEAAREIIS